jgi:glycine/D-amino acid oxidase-like deaminating enzyme
VKTPMKTIVIGGGIIGASIAYHLAVRGAGVTVLDGGNRGGIATPASFAWINSAPGNDRIYHELRLKAILDWHRLQQDLETGDEGHDLPINWHGSLWWEDDPSDVESGTATAAARGYPIRLIDQDTAQAQEPYLRTAPKVSALSSIEGSLSPVETALVLLDAAVANGAQVLEETVESLIVDGTNVTGVRTESGDKMADCVILAAGIATAELAAQAGVIVPMDNSPGFLMQTAVTTPLIRGVTLSPGIHVRQNADGRIVAGRDFGGGPAPDDHVAEAQMLLAGTKALFSDSDGLEVETWTLAQRPTPADGHPIIGPAEGVSGLYITVMHSGVTLAALVGRLTAEEILDTGPVDVLEPYRLSRF